MRVTCCKMLCCLPITFCLVHTVNRFDLWISKQYRRLAFKTMYVQFCNEAKSCAHWLVNETLWYETETRPRHLMFSPRRDRDRDLPTFPRDRDETETFGNYVSRPSRDRDVETETTSLVDTYLSCEDMARQRCAMVPRWRFLTTFWVLYLQRAPCSIFQTCILNSR